LFRKICGRGKKRPHTTSCCCGTTSGRYLREEVKGDHLTAEQYQSLLRRSASRRNDAASAPESAGAGHRPHQEAAIAPVACVALASPHRANRRECRGPGSTACAHANSAVTRTHAEPDCTASPPTRNGASSLPRRCSSTSCVASRPPRCRARRARASHPARARASHPATRVIAREPQRRRNLAFRP
jgi:hypothetical protein